MSDLALLVLDIGELIMAALDDLAASVTNLQTADVAVTSELSKLVASIQALSAQLSQLTGGATADQVEAVVAQLDQVTKDATDAIAAAEAAVSPPTP